MIHDPAITGLIIVSFIMPVASDTVTYSQIRLNPHTALQTNPPNFKQTTGS